MNLASPFWPQRSGLLRGFDPIVDATGGQYEGFNYLGVGGLLIVMAAIMLEGRRMAALLARHRMLVLVCAGAAVFALSYRVFLFDTKLLDVADLLRLMHAWRPRAVPAPMPAGQHDASSVTGVLALLAVFRSSGRMFWIVWYAAVLFGLAIVLRRLAPGPAVAFVTAYCLLQLIDTNPLRARQAMLIRSDPPALLDTAAWEARMRTAERVHVDPTYVCGGERHWLPNMELQRAAVRVGRPINSVYNPRLSEDCADSARMARNGPWEPGTLYVFLDGPPEGVADRWRPSGLACWRFSEGLWCLGPKDAP
jgi:hypothetical protein